MHRSGRLIGRAAIVTGAAQGIGRAVALAGSRFMTGETFFVDGGAHASA